jgi:hypothetical protein
MESGDGCGTYALLERECVAYSSVPSYNCQHAKGHEPDQRQKWPKVLLSSCAAFIPNKHREAPPGRAGRGLGAAVSGRSRCGRVTRSG